MSFEFIVTVNDVLQMRGGLTQATAFLIGRYGSLDDGINAGARILPEWLPMPPKPASNFAEAALPHGSFRHLASLGSVGPVGSAHGGATRQGGSVSDRPA